MKVKIKIFKSQESVFKELCREDHIHWDMYDDGSQLSGIISGVPIRMLSFYYMSAKRYLIIRTFEVIEEQDKAGIEAINHLKQDLNARSKQGRIQDKNGNTDEAGNT